MIMKGTYYKTPIDFKALIEKRDLAKTTLATSIDQQLFLLATTAWGECKFDEGFGIGFWEVDFDMLKSDANLKLLVKESLKESIQRYEKRLFVQEVEVEVTHQNLSTLEKTRTKKKIIIYIKGFIRETNNPYEYRTHLFIAPLSY